MNKPLKKVIAREGLIILTIGLLLILATFFPNKLTVRDNNIKPGASDEVFEVTVESRPFMNKICTVIRNKNKNTPESTWDKYITKADSTKTLQTDFIIIKEELLLSDVKSSLIFPFLFLGYPIYLLIRFILWAIRALKEK